MVLGPHDDVQWSVLGIAEDPQAVGQACSEVADGDVGYALTADAPTDPALANVYATLESRSQAGTVAACFERHGADEVRISRVADVTSFSPN